MRLVQAPRPVHRYTRTSGSANYTPVSPFRILDTRPNTGAACRPDLGANFTRKLQITGVTGLPVRS